ncbi:MAG: DUF1566 domain-containing protein [Marinilabiliales bacterium]|nr:DUF1566 domain-containing protein [Marinilabiliales bacterium]
MLWVRRFSRLLGFSLLTAFLIACAASAADTVTVATTLPLFPLPDTGQTLSYTDTPGEDSDYNLHAPSFVDHGDGTVTDGVTGLMWQKQDGGEMTFDRAAAYVRSLALGGYRDWRLPTARELFDIHSFDRINPALNGTYFTKTAAEYWWSGETRSDAAGYVWVTNAGGGLGAHPKAETLSAGGSKRFHVRVVRGTQSQEVPQYHFKDNGDGTVSDLYTGLMWQQVAGQEPVVWEDALHQAAALSLGGKRDWRLPNIKELESLRIATRGNPCFDPTFFRSVNIGNFWSSTSMANGASKAWNLHTEFGLVSYSEKTTKAFSLFVRGGLN